MATFFILKILYDINLSGTEKEVLQFYKKNTDNQMTNKLTTNCISIPIILFYF